MARVDEHNDQQSEEDRDQDDLIDYENEEGAPTVPFDPTKIRIDTRHMTVDLLVQRIENNEIDLNPDFQRERALWKPIQQSRLIESLLIRIPIPAFYVDATVEDRWVVVDGLQRLSVFELFIVKKTLRLCELEYLNQYNGKTWDELPRPMQRRILETQVVVYTIQAGTPSDVKFNIFKRINTGGLPLSPQEIRHALNQGVPTDFLKRCSEAPIFAKIFGKFTKRRRMVDREYILRFLAFADDRWRSYSDSATNMDKFVTDHMASLGKLKPAELDALYARFVRAVQGAFDLFGEDAFRKRYERASVKHPINKALFEAWAVNLDAISDEDLSLLVQRKSDVQSAFIELMHDSEFDAAITGGTRDTGKVRLRFGAIQTLIHHVLVQAVRV